MSKIAEKLTILCGTGQAVLQRLSHNKRVLSSATLRPSFLGDVQYSKVLAALLKNFPEFEPTVEKTPGYDLLTGKAKVFFEELEPFYFTFVDAFEFKEAALSTLLETANSTTEMRMETNPTLTTAFLNLVNLYAQINLFVSALAESKVVLAVYCKLYFFIKCVNEPNYARVSSYVVQCDNAVKAMQDEVKTLSTLIGHTLVSFTQLYLKLRTVSVLRKESALNLTLRPEEMAKPITDKFHFEMINDTDMYLWITLGLLICPDALSIPGTVDLVKVALGEGYVIPVFRQTTVQVHGEYENLFANFKSKNANLTKQKKMVKDVLVDAVHKAPQRHKERRVYLRQELSALLHLFTDKPMLLAPKFQLLLCALSLGKEEVFWYFRHLKANPPKSVAKKITEDDMKDNRISELIFLIDQLVLLVRKHQQIIQKYYLEYLGGADVKQLTILCNASFMSSVPVGIGQIAKSIMEELQRLSDGTNHDFKALRLNWFRAECALSSRQNPAALLKVKDAVDRFNLVVHHTRFVDDIDGLLSQHASLKGLWYWNQPLLEVFSASIKDGPNQPLHAMAFFRLLAEFPSNSTLYNPDEKQEIGLEVVNKAEKMLTEMTSRIAALLHEIAKQYIQFDGQLADVNAAYPLLLKRKDFKPAKDFVAPSIPGDESNYRKRPQIDKLRLYERNAWQLCSALNEFESIAVYDHLFVPRQFLRDKLLDGLRKFIRTVAIIEIPDERHHPEKAPQRPSILEKQVNTYIGVLKAVENFVDLDIDSMVREALIGEVWVPALGKSGSLDWVQETDAKFENRTIGTFVTWYGEFLSKKMIIPGIVFSPSRKGFVSKTGLGFKAELYADVMEFKSLANLVGPYGIKLVDREVLKFILSNVNSIKDHVSHNKNALEELKQNYHNEIQCGEILKKLKDAQSFIMKSIAMGNALCFREILYEGLQHTVEENTPYIFSTINSCFHQYRTNTFLTPELLPLDVLAKDCGIQVTTADQALKKFISQSIGSADAALWDLLPFMYAAAFTAIVWKEAQYIPVLEGHSNNAHTLAKTINDLIVAFRAVTTTSNDEKEITASLVSFVECSSVLLLRLAKNAKQDKHGPIDFPSVIVFMDKFVEECPLLTTETLEKCLPYALLRNEWRSIYAPKGMKKTDKDLGDDTF